MLTQWAHSRPGCAREPSGRWSCSRRRSGGRSTRSRRRSRWSTSTGSRRTCSACSRTRDAHGIALWPHTKTHKSPEIGLRQLALGAGGLTVAKTGEAEVFQEAGAPRILVHYPPFGADKWERLARLAAEGVELTVAVDGLAPAEGLVRRARAARRDARRCSSRSTSGCTAPARRRAAGALALAQELSRLPAVEVGRHQLLSGPLPRRRRDGPRARRRPSTRCCARRATRSRPRACAATASRAARRRRATSRTRPASTSCARARTRCSTATTSRTAGSTRARSAVEVTVISDAVPGQIVIDAGSKTLTSDTHPDGGHGAIVGLPDADLHTINEEHGYVDVVGARASGPRSATACRSSRTTPAAASTCTTACSPCATASSTT